MVNLTTREPDVCHPEGTKTRSTVDPIMEAASDA